MLFPTTEDIMSKPEKQLPANGSDDLEGGHPKKLSIKLRIATTEFGHRLMCNAKKRISQKADLTLGPDQQ